MHHPHQPDHPIPAPKIQTYVRTILPSRVGVGAALLPGYVEDWNIVIAAGMIRLCTILTDVLHVAVEHKNKIFLIRTDIARGVPPIRQRSLNLMPSVSDECENQP